jgi:hypothetical protein
MNQLLASLDSDDLAVNTLDLDLDIIQRVVFGFEILKRHGFVGI